VELKYLSRVVGFLSLLQVSLTSVGRVLRSQPSSPALQSQAGVLDGTAIYESLLISDIIAYMYYLEHIPIQIANLKYNRNISDDRIAISCPM
jgi:hypothetical protein